MILVIYDHWDEFVICASVFLELYNSKWVWWGSCCMDNSVMTCNESHLICGINQSADWIIRSDRRWLSCQCVVFNLVIADYWLLHCNTVPWQYSRLHYGVFSLLAQPRTTLQPVLNIIIRHYAVTLNQKRQMCSVGHFLMAWRKKYIRCWHHKHVSSCDDTREKWNSRKRSVTETISPIQKVISQALIQSSFKW